MVYNAQETLSVIPPDKEDGGTWSFLFESTQSVDDAFAWSPFSVDAEVLSELQTHWKLKRILIQISNEPYSSHVLQKSSMSCDNTRISPAGVTITVEFATTAADRSKSTVVELIQFLTDQQWVLAPFHSTKSARLHRYIDQKSPETYQINLPSEGGAAVSAEGMHTWFHKFLPCQGRSGLLEIHSPTEWSNLYLQSNYGRRGLWTELVLPSKSPKISANLSTGIFWSTEPDTFNKRNSPTSWQSILGTRSNQISMCPIIQSTTLQITSHVPKSEPQHWDLSSNNGRLDEIAIDIAKTSSEVVSENLGVWTLSTHLERLHGPANHGRFVATIETSSISCGSHFVLEQAIPREVLKPSWQSYRLVQQTYLQSNRTWSTPANMDPIKPFVEWTDDGFLILSANARLPPMSRMHMILEYGPAFLSSFEHFPSNANRGIEIAPATAQITFDGLDCRTNDNSTLATTLFSNSLLIHPPTPDMSMPFNVLSLSSTLAAFCVGAVINMLIRKGREQIKYQLDPSSKPPSLLARIKKKLGLPKGRLQSERDEKVEDRVREKTD